MLFKQGWSVVTVFRHVGRGHVAMQKYSDAYTVTQSISLLWTGNSLIQKDGVPDFTAGTKNSLQPQSCSSGLHVAVLGKGFFFNQDLYC